VESIAGSIGESAGHTFAASIGKSIANTFFIKYRYWYSQYAKQLCFASHSLTVVCGLAVMANTCKKFMINGECTAEAATGPKSTYKFRCKIRMQNNFYIYVIETNTCRSELTQFVPCARRMKK